MALLKATLRRIELEKKLPHRMFLFDPAAHSYSIVEVYTHGVPEEYEAFQKGFVYLRHRECYTMAVADLRTGLAANLYETYARARKKLLTCHNANTERTRAKIKELREGLAKNQDQVTLSLKWSDEYHKFQPWHQ